MTKVISSVSRRAAVDNSFMHVFVGITVANAAVIKGKSCVGVVVWALPLFLCCFAVSATKRKSGWGICGSSCCVVVFLCYLS